jgi:3'(2'), 5'-bisphosphate nucleotidase
MDIEDLLGKAKVAATCAGSAIREVYREDFAVEYKEDESPLTMADMAANAVIESVLKRTGIPILSEEGRDIPYEERKDWEYLWVVDPLDGTKEFVKRNGEFTVNIALVKNGVPVLGVIYVPVTDILYYGSEKGSFKAKACCPETLQKLPIKTDREGFVAIGSRSHSSPQSEAYFKILSKEHPDLELVTMGSSLKICLVAEGAADVYPRFAPTMEWDTAAGHAIAKFAGKEFIDFHTNKEMAYNRENLRNNWFIVK